MLSYRKTLLKIKHETLCNDSKAGELVILTFQTTSQFFNAPG